MGSLNHCLSLHDCPKPVADTIRAAAAGYREQGLPVQDAMEQAVMDAISNLSKQRKVLISQGGIDEDTQTEVKKRDQESEVVAAVRADIQARSGKDAPADIEEVSVSGRKADTLRRVAELFGKKVIFFRGDFANGAVNLNFPDTILVNIGLDQKGLFVVGHELFHTLRKDNPELYQQMTEAISHYVRDFGQFEKEFRAEFGDLSTDEIVEEFMADLSGEAFTDPDFYQALFDTNPDLFQRITAKLKELFDRIIGLSETHLSDVKEARKVLLAAMKTHAAGQSEVRSESPDVETPEVRGARTPAQKANDERLRRERTQINPDKDDLFKAISKLGGIDIAEVEKEAGKTVTDASREINRRGVFGKPVLRRKNGLSLDRMRETLAGHGFHFDTINDLLEGIDAAMRGDEVFSQDSDFEAYAQKAEEDYLARIDPFEFTDTQLVEDGYNDLSEDGKAAYEALYADAIALLGDEQMTDLVERLAVQYENDADFYEAATQAIQEEINARTNEENTQRPAAEGSRESTESRREVAGNEADGSRKGVPAQKVGEDGKLFTTPPTFGKGQKKQNATLDDMALYSEPLERADADRQNEMFDTKFSRKQTDTPEFKKWFGDSKVVDEQGAPLVVYHATRADFNEFTEVPAGDFGFHFGPAEAAEDRLEGTRGKLHVAGQGVAGSGENIIPVYLAIQNPLRVEDPGYFSVSDPADNAFAMQLRDLGIDIKDGASNEELRSAVESAGYDGMVYENEQEGGGDSYVAFSPTQIKSVFNRGTFGQRPLAFDGENDSFFAEHPVDGLVGDASFLGNFANTRTFKKFGLEGFDIPSRLLVGSRVVSMLQNQQVFDAVVSLLPVNMMNILLRRQLSPKKLLSDVAMLENLFAVDGNNSIPFSIDESAVLADGMTRLVAENSTGFLNLGRAPGNEFSTSFARDKDSGGLGSKITSMATESAPTFGDTGRESGERSSTGETRQNNRHNLPPQEFSIFYNKKEGVATIETYDPNNPDIRYSRKPVDTPLLEWYKKVQTDADRAALDTLAEQNSKDRADYNRDVPRQVLQRAAAYVGFLKAQLADQFDLHVKAYNDELQDVNLDIVVTDKQGRSVAVMSRVFYGGNAEKSLYLSVLKNITAGYTEVGQDNPDAVKTGLLAPLYDAEADYIKAMGVKATVVLEHDRTRDAFLKRHPGARRVAGKTYEVSYPTGKDYDGAAGAQWLQLAFDNTNREVTYAEIYLHTAIWAKQVSGRAGKPYGRTARQSEKDRAGQLGTSWAEIENGTDRGGSDGQPTVSSLGREAEAGFRTTFGNFDWNDTPADTRYSRKPGVSFDYRRNASESEKLRSEQLAFDFRPDRQTTSLLANAIAADFRERGGTTLLGQKIGSPRDLATLAQIYRNPSFETFRMFFVKNNVVVGQTAVTSRLPGAAYIFPGEPSDENTAAGFADLNNQMKALEADGYWLLHNHPSGRVVGSQEDANLTRNFDQKIPGFRGHVIINHNKYFVLTVKQDGTARGEEYNKFFTETDTLLKPSKPHPILGRSLTGPDDLVRVGGELKTRKGYFSLVGHNATGVRGIMEVPTDYAERQGRLAAIVRKFALQTGSMDVFAILPVTASSELTSAAYKGVEQGFVRDAVTEDGVSILGLTRHNPNLYFGQKIRGRKVAEDETKFSRRYSDEKIFGNSGTVARETLSEGRDIDLPAFAITQKEARLIQDQGGGVFVVRIAGYDTPGEQGWYLIDTGEINRRVKPYDGSPERDAYSPQLTNLVRRVSSRDKVQLESRLVDGRPQVVLAGDTKFSRKQDNLGFYSGLAAEMDETIFDQKQMTGGRLLNKLEKAKKTKTQTVKQDEIDAIGLEDYLRLNADKTLTKDEVVQFIEDNGVRVEEVVKGTKGDDQVTRKASKALRTLVIENDNLGYDDSAEPVSDLLVGVLKVDDVEWNSEEDKEKAKNLLGNYQASAAKPAKFGKYTLPGGTNYREVLLTLPESKQSKLDKINARYNQIVEKYGVPVQDLPDAAKAEINRLTSEHDRIADMPESDFKSSHWDEPNVLAHIRLNDREVNGEKVLFVEEIQSDYAAEGRKKGFNDPEATAEYQRRNKEAVKALSDEGMNPSPYDLGWVLSDREHADQRTTETINKRVDFLSAHFGKEWVSDTRKLMKKAVPSQVPPAPFVTSSAWQSLALKRVMRIAAEEGYDRVAWVNGEQTADRYSLDKQVEAVGYVKNKDGTFEIQAYRPGSNMIDTVYHEKKVKPDEIENVFGKEIARRIIDGVGEQDGDLTLLQGDDLKIEAKWARNLYDMAVPKWMEKFGKKYGAKVQPINLTVPLEIGKGWADDAVIRAINNEGESKQLSIPVNRRMVEGVTAGQTLFSRKPLPSTIGQKFDNDQTRKAVDSFGSALTHVNRKSLADNLDRLRTLMVDRYNPIRSQLGDQVYKLHKLLNNSAAVTGTFLQHGKLTWRQGALAVETKDKGFIPWLKSLGTDGEYFLYWVAAKRSEQLAAEGRENWISDDERKRIIAEATKGRPELEQKFEQWNKELQGYNKNILDIAEEAGLIDPEARENWEQHYYLPFYRLTENEQTGEDFLKAPVNSKKFLSAGIKRLKGGDSLLGDPMSNLIHNWAHLISQSQMNMARSAAGQLMIDLGLADQMKASDLSKIVGSHTEHIVKDAYGNLLETFDKKSDADQHAAITGGTVSSRSSITRARHEAAGILSYQRGGKPVYLKPHDIDLFNALAHVNVQGLDNFITRFFMGAKRLLTAGATFGVGFRIANLLRDTLHTAVVSKSFRPVIDTGKGLVQVWRKSPDYIALMASGGGFSQGYLDSGDPKALARSIKKIVNSEGRGAEGRILDTPKKLLAFWERVGHASEMAARTQLYTNLKDKGATHAEAAFEARDLLDFASSGQSQVVKVATAIVPFLNARMQGLDRLARGAAANPAGFAVKGAVLAAASLALWAMYRDDDRYKDLEDWDKWQYHHFWIGDDHYRIPKAFEVGAIFSTMFESSAEVLSGNEEFDFFVDMAVHTLTQTFAIGAPALISPALEVYANKSMFTGRQIESEWMKQLPAGLRSKPWTPEVLKDIGEALNISPVKLQTVMRGYGSTFASILFTLSDQAYKLSPDTVRPQQTATEFLGLDRFVKDRPENIKQATRFYEFAEEATKLFNAVKIYQETGSMQTAQKMVKENPDYLARKKLVTIVNNQLSLIRRREKFIWNNDDMSADEKRRLLDQTKEQKNKIYRMAYEQVQRFDD